jgi:hypothetical protein
MDYLKQFSKQLYSHFVNEESRLEKIEKFAQGPSAYELQSWDLNLDLPTTASILLQIHLQLSLLCL